jgi:hypothetical protein
MTRISTKNLLNMAIAATVAFGVGSVALTAHAEEHHDNRRGGDHRDNRGHGGYGGGYYNPPPVVYGSPCGYGNCAPPVVYGPGIGIVLPNVVIGIH